jgi:hypothetical protein
MSHSSDDGLDLRGGTSRLAIVESYATSVVAHVVARFRFCGCPTPSEGWVRALQGRRCTRYEARIAQKKEGGPWHVQDPPCCASAEPVLASAVFYCAVTVTVPRFIAAAPLAWAMTAT